MKDFESEYRSVFKLTFRFCSLAVLLVLLGLPFTTAFADDYGRWDGVPQIRGGSEVPGWRFGIRSDSGGFEIYRRDHGGWHRVPGSGVQLAGDPRYPWLLNAKNRIYRWNGHTWRRVSGRAWKLADGWVLGTDRQRGGYGIYRWDGRRFDRVPGGAVDIGGSYHRPWIVNDRGARFEWTDHGWRPLGRGFRNGFSDRRDHPYGDYRDDRRWDGRFDGPRDRDFGPDGRHDRFDREGRQDDGRRDNRDDRRFLQ